MGRDANAGQVSGSAAEIYDAFFVPALFGAWAGPLCTAAGITEGDSVLDVACGTGAATREALARAGSGGQVTGLDCNDGMLDVAAARSSDIVWIAGQAENLPFPAHAFDRVLCQFGLMFFSDRVEALREMRRVLRAEGRLALSVWSALDDMPGYTRMVGLVDDMFGTVTGDALRAPFSLGDRGHLADLLSDAGMSDAHVETRKAQALYPSVRDWVRMDVRGWTLADMIDDPGFEALIAAAEREFDDLTDADGTVRFDMAALLVTSPVG